MLEEENEKTKWQEENSNDSIWHVGDNSLEDNGEAENLAEPNHGESNLSSDLKPRPVYIGESSRQVGTRALECVNVSKFKMDSFIL